jgi:hypothetical protein
MFWSDYGIALVTATRIDQPTRWPGNTSLALASVTHINDACADSVAGREALCRQKAHSRVTCRDEVVSLELRQERVAKA